MTTQTPIHASLAFTKIARPVRSYNTPECSRLLPTSQDADMAAKFQLVSDYQPAGDQPKAIEQLVEGFRKGKRFQTLMGATGTGKTFTAANVIQTLGKPTLVLSHNKTLAAQLYKEFKRFFPHNAVC